MHINGLNFLRALGVALVLLYHFYPAFLKGGFLGVDVFFTLSGYLTTALLVNEFSRKDKPGKLLSFFKRRVFRLLPALIFTLIVVIPLTLLISPDFRVNLYKQVLGALTFTTNYYEISIGQSYENQLLPRLFVHTWSLALEMHYYIIWGAFLFIASRLTGAKESRLPRWPLVGVCVVLAAAAYVNMQALTANAMDMSEAYYATTSHFYPFMTGSAAGLAFGFSLPDWVKRMAGKRCFAAVLRGAAVFSTLCIVLLASF
jgi:peptidoglycan/LPS O-acetylase OafA/YrhL